jgi:hypothetical protein
LTHHKEGEVKLDVTKLTDHPDGTLTIEFETDESTLMFLAKIGMLHLIEKSAEKILDGYSDPEGDGNADARDGRDSELFGEIPGL